MTVPQVRLRPAADADEPLLFAVYAASRAAELAPVPWSDEQKLAFLTQQHEAQSSAYRTQHPEGQFLVVESPDGRPIGRLYLARLDGGEIRVLDVALLPEWCGRGIGTTLLNDVIATADREGVVVTLHVELWNPAIRLYERLGFREAARTDVYARMERLPVGTRALS